MSKKCRILILALAAAVIPVAALAQNDYKKYYVNGNWQFNAPISNNFTSKASGWGMSFEGGYFVAPKLGLGLFLNYSTNHKYMPTETLQFGDNSSLTTNQQRALFQLPFGASVRYRLFTDNSFDPYFQMNVGASYAQLSSYISSFKVDDNTWGFYVSPEIGTNIWLNSGKNVGLNLSLYYSFSTNKGAVIKGNVNNLSNIGFRLGLSF